MAGPKIRAAHKPTPAGAAQPKHSKKVVFDDASPKSGKKPAKDDDLLTGLRALGGDEAEYALLKDLESDDTQEFSDHELNV